MRDNQLFIAVRTVLLGLFENLYDIKDVQVLRRYQPVTEGRSQGPTIYMYKLYDHRYGWQKRKDYKKENDPTFYHYERQQMETTFQISAVYPEKPDEPEGYTASDYVKMAAFILQSSQAIEILFEKGIHPERIAEIRNTPFINDKSQWEFLPSFDIILHHIDELESVVPPATVTGRIISWQSQ